MKHSGYVRTENDYYVEPDWVIKALLDVENFDGVVWDPACGSGTIPKVVIARGGCAVGTDLVDRGFGRGGVNFLEVTMPLGDFIVSNPPYGVIEPFIEHALALTTGKVAILARLALLEGQRRREWFKALPLARVLVSSRRVSMPPGGTDVPAKGGTIAYAFFVFEHGYVGAPSLGWLP